MVRAKDLIDRAKERAQAATDPLKHVDEAPDGYHLYGVTTRRQVKLPDGSTVTQYVKTRRDHNDPTRIIDAMRAVLEMDPLPPARPVARQNGALDRDTISVYPMGDPHVGMLAWHEESGEDFDLKIACRNLYEATDKLVNLAPPSEEALIINLGDFFHADNNAAVTSRSGHSLDVDTRWAKMLQAGVAVMIRIIDAALRKHRRVRVINVIGNHDDHSAVMLSICLAQRFHAEPRVEIETSPAGFHKHVFGKNLIATCHGDKTKMQELPGIMASDWPEEWGRTQFRYWYTGHVHHENKKEYPGCIVESFRTLAAKDAYHAHHGYRAGRSMVCDILHRDYGRIMRHEIGVEALR